MRAPQSTAGARARAFIRFVESLRPRQGTIFMCLCFFRVNTPAPYPRLSTYFVFFRQLPPRPPH